MVGPFIPAVPLVQRHAVNLGYGLAGVEIEIVYKPIEFEDKRRSLTMDYLRERYGIQAQDIFFEPRMIVLHHTGLATLQESFAALRLSRLPDTRQYIAAHGLV